MKKVTNKNERHLLLLKFRNAVCVQISLWHALDKVDEILGVDNTAVMNNLDRLFGRGRVSLTEINAVENDYSKRLGDVRVDKLSRKKQRALFVALQTAVQFNKELLLATTSLAKALGCTRKEAVKSISTFAIISDGVDLDERDLQALLDEPEAEGHVRVLGPLES